MVPSNSAEKCEKRYVAQAKMMKRLQLVELEDLPWLPGVVRNGATDYLTFLQDLLAPYKPCGAHLNSLLKDSGASQIIDLCSGAGGPLPLLAKDLRTRDGTIPEILLTDKFPNLNASENFPDGGQIRYLKESIEARKVSHDLRGLRTLFTSFHHFTPHDAEEILRSAVNASEPIAIFELTERSLASLLRVFALSLALFVLTPLLKPQRLSRYLFTYAFPLIPLVVFWDGIASSFRSYSPEELENLARKTGEKFTWSGGRISSIMGSGITYLLGLPSETGPGREE